MPIKPSDLRVGDHVYTWRNGHTYSHHGIYVGDDRVVHFLAGNDSKLSIGSSSGSSQVTMCTVNEFLEGNGVLRRFEYGVSQETFEGRFRGGTCTFANSDSPETVVHRARYLLQKGFGKYNIFRNNCENFALYCKTGILGTGKGVSGQVAFADSIAVYLGKAALALAPVAVSSALATIAVSSTLATIALSSAFIPFCTYRVVKLVRKYRADRCNKDIGIRVDVVIVEVEDIASWCGHGGFEDAPC